MKNLLRLFIVFLTWLFIWQTIVTLFHLPSYLLPSPWQVFTAFHQHIGLLATHSLPTLMETIGGFLIGILLGCIVALSMVFFKSLANWLLPLLIVSQAIPLFAIAPLLVIWFGYGMLSKIITAVMMIFFPITSAFYDGLQRIPPAWLELAQTLNANKWRIFFHLRIPAALPYLASGLRIAAVGAPIGAVISEWVGASEGLGYLMLNANARMQVDLMFAALLVIIIIALALYFSVDNLLKKWVWWAKD